MRKQAADIDISIVLAADTEVAMQGRSIGGSLIGGIGETQEVLEFCAEHGILPQVEMIRIQDVNDAYEKINSEEVRFRYMIDMASLKDYKTDQETARPLAKAG
jgi:D-arabinose 1-dehydrogenase-like Zn-dependent alcohol dehydrogenase